MTTTEIARALDGIEYDASMKDVAALAKESGIVICYGASDDLVEFEGAIHDETGGPGDVHLTDSGLLQRRCDDDSCPHELEIRKRSPRICAVRGAKDGPCWTFQTTIPHEKFKIMEDGEVFGVGVVFRLEDIPLKAAEVEEIRERVKAGTIPDVVAATLAGVLSVEIQGRKP